MLAGSEKSFYFDAVFGPGSSQSSVYTTAVAPLLGRFLDGYNATVMAYGQTASGKTYTMGTMGSYVLCIAVCGAWTCASCMADPVRCACSTCEGDGGPTGVIPRVTSAMFEQLEAREGAQFEVSCSFVEIHNETLHDLLAPKSDANGGVSIMETSEGELMLCGATMVSVSSAQQLREALARGSTRRATGATNMNAQSSRSHAVFTIYLEQTIHHDAVDGDGGAKVEEGADAAGVEEGSKRSKFHLVDLAGSGKPCGCRTCGASALLTNRCFVTRRTRQEDTSCWRHAAGRVDDQPRAASARQRHQRPH